jgi:hypothetical protein
VKPTERGKESGVRSQEPGARYVALVLLVVVVLEKNGEKHPKRGASPFC